MMSQYVTFRDASGTLRGGEIPDGIDASTLSDSEIVARLISRTTILDVRMFDLNQFQIDLHEAFVKAGITSKRHPRLAHIVSEVAMRHIMLFR